MFMQVYLTTYSKPSLSALKEPPSTEKILKKTLMSDLIQSIKHMTEEEKKASEEIRKSIEGKS